MAKRQKPRVKGESVPSGPGEVADTKTVQEWLRFVDRPMATEDTDRENAELTKE